jgi:hypothetical protein
MYPVSVMVWLVTGTDFRTPDVRVMRFANPNDRFDAAARASTTIPQE